MPIRRCALVFSLVLVCAWLSPAANGQSRPDVDPRVEKLLNDISEDRLRTLLTRLVSFGTRSTLSDASSPTRGIGAARQWIFDELRRSSPRLQVSFDTHVLPPQMQLTRQAEIRNVLAVLPGRSARRIYISGHYDSLNSGRRTLDNYSRAATELAPPDLRMDPKFDHNVDAPGANDNGSGTVLTMELARVFAASDLDFDATLVFALWAGEEQAMLGAHAHAQGARLQKIPIEAVLNNDIVGNVQGLDGKTDSRTVRVYSAGPEDSPSRALARHVERVGAAYLPSHRARLMGREDRFSRGSDHVVFRQEGFPAIVFRESVENLSRQHSALDTLDGVDISYLRENARINAAAAATLALAPPSPALSGDRQQLLLSRDPSGADASLRWQRAPGAAGYRVYWRDTWSNDWQHRRDVGNVTQVTLPGLSIDDYVFGVSALGADGFESVVSAYVVVPRDVPPLAPLAGKSEKDAGVR